MSADDVVKALREGEGLPSAIQHILETLPWFFDYDTWRGITTVDELSAAWVEWAAEYRREHPVLA